MVDEPVVMPSEMSVTPESEPQDTAPQQEEVSHAAPELSDAEKNFKALRELREREKFLREKAERERDDARKYAQEMEERFKQQAIPADVVEDLGISPDDLVEGKHLLQQHRLLKQVQKELEDQKAAARKEAQRAEIIAIESRLRKQFNDFDSVVTQENLELLAARDPDATENLRTDGNLYNKAVTAYSLIKQLGIDHRQTTQEELQLQRNASKPRAAAHATIGGTSPLDQANAFANNLTDDLKKQIYRASLEATKNF